LLRHWLPFSSAVNLNDYSYQQLLFVGHHFPPSYRQCYLFTVR
jgi:hypothetical protein